MSFDTVKPQSLTPRVSVQKTEFSQPDDLPEFFSSRRSQVKSSFSNKLTLKSVLESKNRSFEEASYLYKVVKDMPFFADFKSRQNFDESEEEMLINLCRDLKYEKYSIGDVIFKEGDPSQGKFYIVMKGIVYVVQSVAQAINFYESQNRERRADQSRMYSVETSPTIQQLASKKRGNESINSRGTSLDMSPRKSPLRKASRKNTSRFDNDGSATPDSATSLRKATIKAQPILDFFKVESKETPSSSQKKPFASQFSSPANALIEESEENPDANKEIKLLEMENEKAEGNEPVEQGEQNSVVQTDAVKSNQEVAPLKKLRDTTGKLVKIMQVRDMLGKANTKGFSLQKKIKEFGVYRDKVERGGSFGHAALQTEFKQRLATVIAATAVELLVLEKHHLHLVRQHFYKTRLQMKEFLLKYFPVMADVNSSVTIDGYLYLLKEGHYSHDFFICKEGTFQDKVFIIYEGQCQLMKTFTINKSPTGVRKGLDQCRRGAKFVQETLPLTVLEKGSFFGDESLFNGNSLYEYSVKVLSPTATVYSVEKSAFLERFPRMTLEGIRTNYELRRDIHLKTIQSILKARYPSMELVANTQESIKENLNNGYQRERTLSNPITLSTINDRVKPQKRQKSFGVSPLESPKNLKEISRAYNQTFFNSKTLDPTSPTIKFSPRVLTQKIALSARPKFQAAELDRNKLEDYKTKITELLTEERPKVFDDKDDPRILLTYEVMKKRNQKLSKHAPDSLPFKHLDRAVGNLIKNTSISSIPKPHLTSSLEEQKFNFGSDFDFIKKDADDKTKLKSSNIKKEEVMGAGLRQILNGYAESKQKNNRKDFIKEKIIMISSHRSSPVNSLKEGVFFTSASKTHFRSISNISATENTLQAEVFDDRRDSQGFLFVKSPRLDITQGFLPQEARVYGLDKNKNLTTEGKAITEEQRGKSGVENPTLGNLIKKHKMLKALTKPSITLSTSISRNPSLHSCFGVSSPMITPSIQNNLTLTGFKPVGKALTNPNL